MTMTVFENVTENPAKLAEFVAAMMMQAVAAPPQDWRAKKAEIRLALMRESNQ